MQQHSHTIHTLSTLLLSYDCQTENNVEQECDLQVVQSYPDRGG
jgi:hypothetical protein